MYNLLSYCGLIDAKIRASDKDLPVLLSVSHYLISEKHKILPANSVFFGRFFDKSILNMRFFQTFFLILSIYFLYFSGCRL